MDFLIVFLGGGIGAVLRHIVNRAAFAWFGSVFLGTMFGNIVGSFLIGVVVQLLLARGGETEQWRLFLATGVLGGFTTFSAFSLDAVELWQRGDHLTGAAYVVGSVLLSIAALIIGIAVARALYSG